MLRAGLLLCALCSQWRMSSSPSAHAQEPHQAARTHCQMLLQSLRAMSCAHSWKQLRTTAQMTGAASFTYCSGSILEAPVVCCAGIH